MSDQTSDIAEINLHWSQRLLQGLIAGGLRLLVLSPGSRSTPVVLAAQTQTALSIQPILDERSAAFFALGAARTSSRPVALLATSGSAPAHWYPAIIEASQSAVPLILLSADRPPLARHWGANQTIDQTRLFGGFVRAFHDPGLPHGETAALKAIEALGRRAMAQACGPDPGPVHLNLPFEEPLVPAVYREQSERGSTLHQGSEERVAELGRCMASTKTTALAPAHLPTGRGLIICGPVTGQPDPDRRATSKAPDGTSDPSPSFAEALLELSNRRALPVLADPLSDLRFGPWSSGLITSYDSLLRNPELSRHLLPDWVLRFGAAPVSKTLNQWLEGIPTLLVDPAGHWSDPGHDAIDHIQADPILVCQALLSNNAPALSRSEDVQDAGWLNAWHKADAHLHRQQRTLLQANKVSKSWNEAALIQTLLARISAGDGLLCANSLPIRQIDTWSQTRPERLRLFGNRGVSGIDGQFSTLAGLNRGGIPTWGLLGDLSFTHDLAALSLADQLQRPLIVINNGGGRIFDYLPQHGLPDFEPLWRTPVAPDIGKAARLFGLPHRLVSTQKEFNEALDQLASSPPASGFRPALIEVRIDADLSRQDHLDFWRWIAEQPLEAFFTD